ELAGREQAKLEGDLLAPALRHLLRARDLCPLLADAHIRLAASAGRLQRADAPGAYLARACFVLPNSPEVWYLTGVQHLADQQPDQARKNWHRSLELSDRYLSDILSRSARHLRPDEVLDQVLPDNAGILLAAASELYPSPESTPERLPFLEKALFVLE